MRAQVRTGLPAALDVGDQPRVDARVLFRWRPTPAFLPIVALVLGFALPTRLVVAGLGAAGRPAVVLGCLLLFLWLLSFLGPRSWRVRCAPLRWALLVYVLTWLAAYALGYDRGLAPAESRGSDRALIVTAATLGLLLTIAEGLQDRRQLDRVLRALCKAAGFMAFVGWLQFVFVLDVTPYLRLPGLSFNGDLIGVSARGSGGFPRVAGTSAHYIEYGATCGMLLPLAIHYARVADGRYRRRWWLLVGLIGCGVPFSVSRTSFLALAVAMLVMAWGWDGRTRYNAMIVGLAAITMLQAVKPGLLGTIKSLFLNVQDDPSVTGRTQDYEIVGPLIAERPWFGRGPGTFSPEEYIILDNQVLGTILSTGYVGLAATTSLILCALALATSTACQSDARTAELARALSACVAAAVVSSFTFDSLSFPIFAMAFFTAVAGIFALWRVELAGRGDAVLHAAEPAAASA